ncbi:MAG: hypothetical protein ABSG91_21880 [Syntrophobacteraceae bacterium]
MEWYVQKAVAAYGEDSNFEKFRTKAAAWTDLAFELLPDKNSLYELLIEKLKSLTVTNAAFKDFSFDKEGSNKLISSGSFCVHIGRFVRQPSSRGGAIGNSAPTGAGLRALLL